VLALKNKAQTLPRPAAVRRLSNWGALPRRGATRGLPGQDVPAAAGNGRGVMGPERGV